MAQISPDLINFSAYRKTLSSICFMQCPCTTFTLLEPIYLNTK